MPNWQRWKNIMKCYPFEEKRLAKWQPPFIVQPKYDGVRCRAVPLDQGGYILVSSEENPIFSVPHIQNLLGNYQLTAELDGELYCHGMSFEEIISITSRTKNLHQLHREINFHVFDIVNELPQMRRTILLEKLRNIHPKIQVAPFWLCETLEEIMKVYDDLVRQNYEGIIVRNIAAPYVRRRSTYIMKFKPKQWDTYEIIDCVEEVSINGVSKDTLGALVCKSGDGNTFNVGTGFTDERRKQLWDIRGILPGSFAKVQYQHITSGKKVPRFPVFVEVLANEEEHKDIL
jgi:DNA ligase-1